MSKTLTLLLRTVTLSTLLLSPMAQATTGNSITSHNLELPLWSILPFLGLLLTMGFMSFFAANFPHGKLGKLWENNNNKLIIALLWSLPILALLFSLGEWHPLEHNMADYFSFIVLLLALFVISGGIYLEGDLHPSPTVNTTFLAIGAVLANLIGTTGASVLLIRLLLKTNSDRQHTSHLPVFFIFAVSNIGGCLLPIGDPPLFLGYLKGVPFLWTLNLWLEWLTAISLLLIVFFIWDTLAYRKETEYCLRRDDLDYQPLKSKGGINILLLLGVLLAVIFITPDNLQAWRLDYGPWVLLREYLMLLLAGISFLTSPLSSGTRRENNFTFAPILEVAYLFIGIFITMIPALAILKVHGAELGVNQPWQFFWASGSLSAILDNAPTYLTFLSLAQGLVSTNPALYPIPADLAGVGTSAPLLVAISLGSVFMGALTYIGNGPNFMVKAISEEWGYQMPHFFAYTLKYAIPVLIPIFIIITVIFLR